MINLRATVACFALLLMTLMFAAGCAHDDASRDNDAPWEKELIIEFRQDTSEFERRQFYSINYVEFLSQYDSDTVRVRIISGEPVADFIDRLSDDPMVLSIKPVE